MKSNSELQEDVQNSIRWETSMHTAEIGVTAKDGLITLSGTVDSFSQKLNAENAARGVHGVKAVAEDIIIQYGHSIKKNDIELAKNILSVWKSNWEIPANLI